MIACYEMLCKASEHKISWPMEIPWASWESLHFMIPTIFQYIPINMICHWFCPINSNGNRFMQWNIRLCDKRTKIVKYFLTHSSSVFEINKITWTELLLSLCHWNHPELCICLMHSKATYLH
jgi:hypothetical protein